MTNQKNINAQKMATRVLFIGATVNTTLSIVKVVVGALFKSSGLIADGIHSLSDLMTDCAVWLGIKFGRVEPDEKHPFGHGRIETMTSLVVGLVLIVTAIGIGWEAIDSLIEWDIDTPGWPALIAALASLILKEGMYHYTMRVAKVINSPALKANAWHNRSDSLSSLAVLIGITAGQLSPSLAFLDRVAAIAVGILILKAAIEISKHAIDELIDASPSEDEINGLNNQIRMVPGVMGVKSCHIRKSGSSLLVDCEILINGTLPLEEAHTLADIVEGMIRVKEPAVSRVNIHLEPTV